MSDPDSTTAKDIKSLMKARDDLARIVNLREAEIDDLLKQIDDLKAQLARIAALEPDSHYVDGFCTHTCVPEEAIHDAIKNGEPATPPEQTP